MKVFKRVPMPLAASLWVALAACGGGGDGPEPTATALAQTPALSATTRTQAPTLTPTQSPVAPVTTVRTTTPVEVAPQQTSSPVATPTPAPTPAATPAPYLRTIYVDGLAPAASDAGAGSQAQPYKTIAAAMRGLRPGDDVVIAPGVYREGIAVPTLAWGAALTRIRAQTPRTALVKGSAEVSGWTAGTAGTYWVNWTGDEPEQVYRAGAPLKQIGGTVFGGYPADANNALARAHESEGGIWPGRVAGGVNELVPDSFTYDAAARRITVKVSTALVAGQVLEVSVVRQPLQAEAATNLTIDGLDFAHANTSIISRWGAVKVSGSNNSLNDLLVSDMDAACVQLSGTDSALTNSIIQRCGQIGISGSGTRLTIANNRVTHANTRGFNKWWEAGGMKLMGESGLHFATIRNNVVAYNNGDGIWIDWKNTQNLIEGNTTAYNAGFGIQYEASKSAIIRTNVVYGNQMRGIYLLESSDSVVSANSVFGNVMEGIAVVDGTRSASDATLLPLNNRVTANSVAWNDFDRNWVQLVLPGLLYGSMSDSNSFKAETLLPRMSVGFMGTRNPAYPTLAAWRTATLQDDHSMEQLAAMPAEIKQALAAQRLMTPGEMPSFLSSPGTY